MKNIFYRLHNFFWPKIFTLIFLGALLINPASALVKHTAGNDPGKRRFLTFSPTSLSFTVAQNRTTPNKSSYLSSSRGAPSITLSKSFNSSWLILPGGSLGNLSFGINASGLAPGTYTSTVTASALFYENATLQVTLTVYIPGVLSFSPTSISFSVMQNGFTSNKTSTLSSSTGSPSVALSKSANSSWLILPAPSIGTLSFGINASGLAQGTYTSTVTASASNYDPANLQVSLTVTALNTLSFSPTNLYFISVQNGNVANQSSVLSANTGSPSIALSQSANTNWLIVPAAQLGSLSFGVNTSGLLPGNYASTVTASSGGYTNALCNIYLTITDPPAVPLKNIKVNFQDSLTTPPAGWLVDFGQPYGLRTLANQGSGNKYGWLKRADGTPLDLTKNGRNRTTPADVLLATLMHMQGNDILNFAGTPIEGIWEAEVPNGFYDIAVSVGDDTKLDSKHTINVEGVNAIAAFVPTSGAKFKSATVTVQVSDGRLTIDAIGGTNTKINWITIQPARPSIISVYPADSSVDVDEHASVSTNIIRLPNSGINNNTLTSSSVFLTEKISGAVVPANVNGTGGGDAITLVPDSALKTNTVYQFNVTSAVKDLSGSSFIPYSSIFTTGSGSGSKPFPVQFEKINLPTAVGRHSSLTIGPDGKLYALTIDGIIKRFTINPDGTLSSPQLIYTLQDAYGSRTPRLSVGFAFDPSATASNLIAWITHDTYTFTNAPDWDGKLSKLAGNNLQSITDVLINLPRSAKDHVTNSIAFGPDGGLYFTQGSTSAMGREDLTWSHRNEHLLSAAVLKLDLTKLGALPLDVKTSDGGGSYNPYSLNAPLTIYASGVRNAYDLVWHSNGSLYTPTNGSAAGGNTPASVNGTQRPDGSFYNGPVVPALTNVQQTQYDYLFRIVKGGYYGHPNPTRGEYVMNGGNPTNSADVAEVVAYPVGTLPDANWRGNAFDFKNNASPDGAIEYKSNAFNGALKGKLLVVRYSQHDDIITLTPGISKNIDSAIEGSSITGFSGFADPLDLTEDVSNGNLYVSEYGGDSGKITLLRPTAIKASRGVAETYVKNNSSKKYSGKVTNASQGCDEGTNFTTAVDDPLKRLSFLQQPKISPNPVQKRVNIYFPSNYKGKYVLQILDASGRLYDIKKINLAEGGTNMQMDVSKLLLKPGVYLYKITNTRNTSDVLKLIVE